MDAIIEMATIFGKNKMKSTAMLHGVVFDCTIGTIGDKGFPLWHVVQWSAYNTRPEEGDTLTSDVKEAVKFLEQLLELDPRRRISARAALQSDFLASEDTESEGDEMEVL